MSRTKVATNFERHKLLIRSFPKYRSNKSMENLHHPTMILKIVYKQEKIKKQEKSKSHSLNKL